MTALVSFWLRFKLKFNQLIAKFLIRYKWIKQEIYTPQELNDLLATSFPHHLPLELPGSKGELLLLDCELSIPSASTALHLQLFCALNVKVAGQDIYRSHLLVNGAVTPYYQVNEKTIRLKGMQLNEIRLVNDDYAFIQSSAKLVTLFMPAPFKSALLGTAALTFSLLKGMIPSDLYNYLMIYTSASKQKVLDFHKPEIERLVLKEVEQEDWFYQLDESDFEEALFAELGQQVVVENGLLVFKFHDI